MSVTLAACLAVATLAACGGGSSDSASTTPALANAQTLAQVGSYAVTRAMLSQWMTVDVGSDYYKLTRRRVPAQLVSEPPNYRACVAAGEGLASDAGKGRPAPGTLASTCEQLYRAIRAETLTFLVSSYWLINFDAAHGIAVTQAQVQRSLEQVKAKEYPRPGEFQRSLQARDRTLSQELFLARVDLLKQRLRQALAKKGHGQAELAGAVNEDANSAVCRAGYVVAHCKGIVGHRYSGPLPRTLLRALAPGTRAG